MSKENEQIVWLDDYDGGKYPACPRCKELAYFFDHCCFCGLVFEQNDEALKELQHVDQIEKDGYTIIQTQNRHVHIYAPDGTLISHATCTFKLSEKRLLKLLKNTIKKGEKNDEKTIDGSVD